MILGGVLGGCISVALSYLCRVNPGISDIIHRAVTTIGFFHTAFESMQYIQHLLNVGCHGYTIEERKDISIMPQQTSNLIFVNQKWVGGVEL